MRLVVGHAPHDDTNVAASSVPSPVTGRAPVLTAVAALLACAGLTMPAVACCAGDKRSGHVSPGGCHRRSRDGVGRRSQGQAGVAPEPSSSRTSRARGAASCGSSMCLALVTSTYRTPLSGDRALGLVGGRADKVCAVVNSVRGAAHG